MTLKTLSKRLRTMADEVDAELKPKPAPKPSPKKPKAVTLFEFRKGDLADIGPSKKVPRTGVGKASQVGSLFYSGGYFSPSIQSDGTMRCVVTPSQIRMSGAGPKHTMFRPHLPAGLKYGSTDLGVTYRTTLELTDVNTRGNIKAGFAMPWQIWGPGGSYNPPMSIYRSRDDWAATLKAGNPKKSPLVGVTSKIKATPTSTIVITSKAHATDGIFKVEINGTELANLTGIPTSLSNYKGPPVMTIGCYTYNSVKDDIGFDFESILIEKVA